MLRTKCHKAATVELSRPTFNVISFNISVSHLLASIIYFPLYVIHLSCLGSEQPHSSHALSHEPKNIVLLLIMAALWNTAGHYIFVLLFLLLFFSFFFPSPILSGRNLDVYHTSTRDVALVRIRKSEMCCMWLAEIQDAKIMQKIAIYALSHNFVGLYLRNSDVYRLSEKLVKQQYLLHISNMVNFDRPTNG